LGEGLGRNIFANGFHFGGGFVVCLVVGFDAMTLAELHQKTMKL
jgi:hypothetical protein